MTKPSSKPDLDQDRTDFFASLRTGLVIGAAALVIVLPALHYWKKPAVTIFPRAAATAPAAPQLAATPAVRPPPRLASFGNYQPTDAVRQIANWSVDSGDHQDMAIVVVDKKDARVWVFDPRGQVLATSPALLGAAIGDESAPGIGEKPLSQVKPQEKTTPAGRFIAEAGTNLGGEDIVWVSYDLAVSMHRVRPTVKSERRLERLASPTSADNRISYGCINLPPAFYEKVLSPTVHKYGAVIYVLPETRSAAEMFGAYEVPVATAVAQR